MTIHISSSVSPEDVARLLAHGFRVVVSYGRPVA